MKFMNTINEIYEYDSFHEQDIWNLIFNILNQILFYIEKK